MQTLPDTLCYLNGEYTALCNAKVSVLDRGFMFGDGVYEVIPAYVTSAMTASMSTWRAWAAAWARCESPTRTRATNGWSAAAR